MLLRKLQQKIVSWKKRSLKRRYKHWRRQTDSCKHNLKELLHHKRNNYNNQYYNDNKILLHTVNIIMYNYMYTISVLDNDGRYGDITYSPSKPSGMSNYCKIILGSIIDRIECCFIWYTGTGIKVACTVLLLVKLRRVTMYTQWHWVYHRITKLL